MSITIDLKILRQKSETVRTSEEIQDVIKQLKENLPPTALGIAAPQINIHKRIFLANLNSGPYAFVNPVITNLSTKMMPSTEACLSLPGIQRCIKRHEQIIIYADKIIDLNTQNIFKSLELKYQDACIAQHEHDHLNGVLIIDHPEVKSRHQKYLDNKENRKHKFKSTRQKLSNNTQQIVMSYELLTDKQKKKEKRRNRKERIRVEIAERYLAEKNGLFDDN